MKNFLSANKKIVVGIILTIIAIILAIIFLRSPKNTPPESNNFANNQNLPTNTGKNQVENLKGPIIQGQTDNSVQTLPANNGGNDYLSSLFGGQTGNTSQNSPTIKSLQDIYSQMPPANQNPTAGDPKIAVLKKFGNNAGAIVNKYPINALIINDLFTRAISTTTPVSQTDLDALSNLANNYKSIGSELSALQAPSEIADLSLKLAVNYSATGDSLQKLAGNAAGGKIPAQSFQDYGISAKNLNDSYFNLMKYFRDNNISFDKSEAGFVFMMAM